MQSDGYTADNVQWTTKLAPNVGPLNFTDFNAYATCKVATAHTVVKITNLHQLLLQQQYGIRSSVCDDVL